MEIVQLGQFARRNVRRCIGLRFRRARRGFFGRVTRVANGRLDSGRAIADGAITLGGEALLGAAVVDQLNFMI